MRAILETYARETGTTPRLFKRSSPGAAEFGIARLVRDAHGFRLQFAI